VKKRKKKEAEPGGAAAWLTTFNDLMTLLMVFFVLLFTMGTLDRQKVESFQDSLQSGLGMLLAGQGAAIGLVEPIVNKFSGNTVSPDKLKEKLKDELNKLTPEVGIDQRSDKTPEEVQEEEKGSGRNETKREEIKQHSTPDTPASNSTGDSPDALNPEPDKKSTAMDGTLDALSLEPDIKVTYSRKDARITLENKILFKLGIADISPEGLPSLKKVTGVIKRIPKPVRVEGHTDSLPINTERFPSNWELSASRAVNVVKYFIEKGKIDPKRFSAVGYGDSKPLHPNDSPESRAGNRRVEIVIIKDQGK